MSYWKKVCLGLVVFAAMTLASSSQTFTTIGYFPFDVETFSSLIQGRDGNFYVTAVNAYGFVYKVTPSGVTTDLYSFCQQAGCADGTYPRGNLALGIDGNLYGTTVNGGTHGKGTVFKITPDGAYTVLHSFNSWDGSNPGAGLVLGSDGNFYGNTAVGGAIASCSCGTVFKISSTGKLTTLHSFDKTDGYYPYSPLVQGSDGSFYGTTDFGGRTTDGKNGLGTVFKFTLAGEFESLHSFQSSSEGLNPAAALVQGTDGAFYGTTYGGGLVGFGCPGGCGTIFKIGPGGAFTSLDTFASSNGGLPQSAMVQATDGKLYGETPLSGSGNPGEIFSVTLPRTLKTEYGFDRSSGGGGATALLQSTDGKFYGTYGAPGAFFSFDVGLRPFVAFVISSGKVGNTAQILGQGLTGATSVTFNGVGAAKFSVVSDTYMTAVVPAGATTGAVVVATPAGNLSSNVSFRISK